MPRLADDPAAPGTIAGPDASRHFWPMPKKTQSQTGATADDNRFVARRVRRPIRGNEPNPVKMGSLGPPRMRLARPRFTVWRLMIAVAAVAVLLACWSWVAEIGRRSRQYGLFESLHAGRESNCRILIDIIEAEIQDQEVQIAGMREANPAGHGATEDGARPHANQRSEQEQCRKWLAYHAQLREKYARAARTPWITVPPAPPEPR